MYTEAKVTIVIICNAHRKKVHTTFYSILRQNIVFEYEVFFYSPTNVRPFFWPYSRELEQSPWAGATRFFGPDTSQDMVINAANGEVILFLNGGDVLLPDALAELLDAMDGYQADFVIGAAGRKLPTGGMKKDVSVEQLFRRPKCEILEFPANSPITASTFLTKNSPSRVRLFRRSLYTASQRIFKVATVHKYVCEKMAASVLPEPMKIRESTLLPRKPKSETIKRTNRGRGRQVWLFAERAGQSAEENGWIFFKYCVENAHNADCYYVLADGVANPEEHNDRLITKNSVRWNILIDEASHFFFTDSAADILGSHQDAKKHQNALFVYLTHGVLAYSPGIYQKTHQYIDLVTCASEFAARRHRNNGGSMSANSFLRVWPVGIT